MGDEGGGDGLVYAGLWETGKMLVEYNATGNANVTEIARSLFERIDATYDHKKSFSAHQGFTFQYVAEDGCVFLTAAVDGFPQRVCFAYLEAFKNQYFSKYHGASSLGGLQEFVKSELARYNATPDINRLRGLKNQVSEVTETMRGNMQKALQRGDRLDDLEERSEVLFESSHELLVESKRLRCEICKNNARTIIIVSIVAVVLIAVLILVLVLIFGGSSDSDSNNNPPPPSTNFLLRY